MGPALAAVLLGAGSAVVLEAWLGGFDQVRSSTGAWILAHAWWARLAGDYRAAAAVSLVPNTTYDPLLPALLVGLSGPGSDLVRLGHRLSAAGAGLAILPLALLWRRIGGAAAGAVGALALLFPPFLASAGLVRYDALAIALCLATLATAARAAREDQGRDWGLAGLLAGLTYLGREYLVGPALGGLGVAWLLCLARRREPAAAAGRAGWVLLGLALGALPLPLILGLSPWGGLDALRGYGGREAGGPAVELGRLLSLDLLGPLWVAGLAGWAVALARARDRVAVGVALGAMAPFAAFMLSGQQSPQYYLLLHLLVLSGVAGGVRLLPGRLLPWALFAVLAVPAVQATRQHTPRLLQSDQGRHPSLHSEGWPAQPQEPAELVDQAMAWVGDHPLLVSSQRMENVDALVTLRHGRPAAFVFANWTDRVPEIVSLYGGQPVYYLSIEGRQEGPGGGPAHRLPEGAVVVERWTTAQLSAELALLPGRQARPGEDLCRNGGPVRGACLQAAWLERGGDLGLRAWILERGAAFDQRLTASTRWW